MINSIIFVSMHGCNHHVVFVLRTEFDDLPLTVGKTDMATIVKVMQLPDSGLEIRDRMWLKITISNAVIGEMFLCVSSIFMFLHQVFAKSDSLLLLMM